MLFEFAQFVKEVFPSITPETAKRLIAEAGLAGLTDDQLFATQLGEKLCQGDVVDSLRWIVEAENGTYGRAIAPGMLLSHSCDVDNDEWVTFAPCAPFDRNQPKAGAIRRNQVFDAYYLPAHQSRPELVVDLAQAQAMRSGRILAGIAGGKLHRLDTLTTLGYYHFILKLTLHYLRPQSTGEQRFACAPPFRERIRYAASAMVGLSRYALAGASS